MKKNEKYIKAVIKRYGEVINLKKTPYVLIEILNDYRRILVEDGPPDGGNPCGGVPPSPKAAIRQLDVTTQIATLTAIVKKLDGKINQLLEK